LSETETLLARAKKKNTDISKLYVICPKRPSYRYSIGARVLRTYLYVRKNIHDSLCPRTVIAFRVGKRKRPYDVYILLISSISAIEYDRVTAGYVRGNYYFGERNAPPARYSTRDVVRDVNVSRWLRESGRRHPSDARSRIYTILSYAIVNDRLRENGTAAGTKIAKKPKAGTFALRALANSAAPFTHAVRAKSRTAPRTARTGIGKPF